MTQFWTVLSGIFHDYSKLCNSFGHLASECHHIFTMYILTFQNPRVTYQNISLLVILLKVREVPSENS